MQESTTAGARRLILVRHAKAQPSGPSDHERALSSRGRADAAEAGVWLHEQGIVPDVALVSDALRAQETWAEIATSAQWDLEPDLLAALYAAGPESVFDLLRETKDDAQTLVVIGHIPTIAYLAELLDDGDGDDAAITSLVSGGYPPCAMTVFAVTAGWSHLGSGSGTLKSFHVGGH